MGMKIATTTNEKIERLRKITIFKDLPNNDLEVLAEVLRELPLQSKQFVFRTQDAADQVYFLSSGRVKLYITSREGNELVLDIVEDGEMFGETALAHPSGDGDNRRMLSAQTLRKSVVYSVHANDMVELMRRLPDLAIPLNRAMINHLSRDYNRVQRLGLGTTASRVGHLILDLAARYGKITGQGLYVPFKLTHRELAGLIGTTRETLTATLNRLIDLGLIVGNGRGAVTVLDPVVLQTWAGDAVRKRPGTRGI